MATAQKKRFRWSKKKIIVLVVILVVVVLIGLLWKPNAQQKNVSVDNNYSAQNKLAEAKALANARKELAKNPNDINAMAIVASLTSNHSESKQLYAKLLTNYQNNMKESTATPTTYLAEGNLAIKAGEKNQAKIYYQDAINAAASSTNSYEKSISQQAQTALKEIQ